MTKRKEILAKRYLMNDEPAETLFFGFDVYSKQITYVIKDEKTETPFVIGVHGEWGSGKTSLIRAVKKELECNMPKDWKTVIFDAWEYERIDVVLALLQKIRDAYGHDKAKELSKSILHFMGDVALRKGVGMSIENARGHFSKFINEMTTVNKSLEKIIHGRLIVFVDDLDRCHIDNVLDMLEAIKMFLTTKGVIFVIAADMEKIERAWQLRYKSEEGLEEGRRHVDKIFQLKLSLPPKFGPEMTEFLKKTYPGMLSYDEIKLMIVGCPRNPRKIKQILNLEYFILNGLEFNNQDNSEWIESSSSLNDDVAKIVLVWCILTTSFKGLAKIVKRDPGSLLRMGIICAASGSFADLNNLWPTIQKDSKSRNTIHIHETDLSYTILTESTQQGLDLIVEKSHEDVFRLLQKITSDYKIEYDSSTNVMVPEHEARRIASLLEKITDVGGMTGI